MSSNCKTKLAYVTNSRLPTEKAHGIQIVKMAGTFAELKNIRLSLIVPKRWGLKRLNVAIGDVFQFYGVKENFRIIKLFCIDFLSFDSSLRAILGSFPFWLLEITFSIRTLVYLIFNSYDIIYTRSIGFAFLATIFLRKKLILELHYWPEERERLRKWAWLFRKISGFVVITNPLKEVLIKLGVKNEQIWIAPDGVAEDFFKKISQKTARKKLEIALDKKIVMYTGNLYRWKGVYTLAKAATELDDSFLIYIVGGSEVDDEVKKFRDFVSGQQTNNIILTGFVNPKLIPLHLAAADILILPNSNREYISRHYTSPLKLFEYMASRRPIVASDLPSLREIINENMALMIAPDQPAVLAKAIKKLAENPRMGQKLAAAAYQKVTNFTWKRRAQGIMNFINNISENVRN